MLFMQPTTLSTKSPSCFRTASGDTWRFRSFRVYGFVSSGFEVQGSHFGPCRLPVTQYLPLEARSLTHAAKFVRVVQEGNGVVIHVLFAQ